MSVDHGRLDIFVAQELLHRPDVVAAFKKMGCERMPERVASGSFYQTRPSDSFPHRLLNKRRVHMMPAFLVGFLVLPADFLRKHPLPEPVLRCIGILAINGRRQLYMSPSSRQILFVNCFYLLQVFPKGFF